MSAVGATLALPWADAADGLNAGFLIREDHALRAQLSGMTVHSANGPVGGIPVSVYFRLPEDEVRARSFPYVIIDFLNIARDQTREHRGRVTLLDEYHPAGIARVTPWPIPVSIQYQVSTFARNIQQDREMIGELLTRLPFRFGALTITGSRGARDDNSLRRLDLLSGPVTRDTKEGGKRIFSKVYSIAVASELFLEQVVALAKVRSVWLDPPTVSDWVGPVTHPTQVAP